MLINGSNQFVNNKAGRSGGISTRGTHNLKILGSNNISNNFTNEFGGGLHSDRDFDLILSGMNLFTYNKGESRGGGIYFSNDPDSKIFANILINGFNIISYNNGANGGEISTTSTVNFTIQGKNQIFKNIASNTGGGIFISIDYYNDYLVGNNTLIIGNNNNIYNNSAEYGGGITYQGAFNFVITGANNIFNNVTNQMVEQYIMNILKTLLSRTLIFLTIT